MVIMSHNASGVLQTLSDGHSFAARSRAKIQNTLTRLGIEQLHGHQGTRILHIEAALPERTQGFQRRMPTEGEEGVGIGPIHLNRNRIHPF